ncbi:AraC family transcriptional regulator [Kordia algicida OT-1]|uniref:Putative AraC-family regulatory protein n=1 Tax=Kordia algicida OT-1 TaxID=391587 RepID=A9EDP9_9FLAO|nr:AraC family transcriptional regulator [Kordia algicida]EDP94207.1 putative AraC-family regulatory protein [Kordia algicida OT-1]
MIRKEKVIGISLFLMVLQLFSAVLIAQNTVIKKKVSTSKNDSIAIKIENTNLKSLQAALQRAKQTENTSKIADAYLQYSEYYLRDLDKKCIIFSDSIIFLTKDLKNNESYPAEGYNQKGRYYYRLGRYKLALDNFTTALDRAKENTMLHATINLNIGLIKNTIERHEESKVIFKDYVRFLESSGLKDSGYRYNRGLFALSHAFTYTGQLDSASYYIDKGISNTLATNDDVGYNYFVLNSGINSYFKQDYAVARDSLLRAKKLFEDDKSQLISLAFTHLFLGKTNKELKKNSVKNFIKVDSILEVTRDVMPELLDAYDYIKDYYKAKGDKETRNKYLEQEIKFRKISQHNYEDLVKDIVTNYDNKILEKERDKIIKEIKDKDNVIIIVLLSLLLAFAGAIYYFFRKQVIHKKRFHKLLEEQQKKKELIEAKQKEKLAQKEKSSVVVSENTIKELPEDLVNDILTKLEKFEATDKFVKKKYTLPQLAKELNTNGTYLSKVINETKQVNFSNYLNQLRIEYAIERITNDSRFREYTIKAIAEECGFKTQQSFSAAFYKKTGIKPSFFVRELKNKIKNVNN